MILGDAMIKTIEFGKKWNVKTKNSKK